MDYIVCGYLCLLSIVDIKYKKLPLWSLMLGVLGSMIYSVEKFGIAMMFFMTLPGIFLSIVAILLPQSLGIGDGIIAVMYGMVYGWRKLSIWLLMAFCLAAITGVCYQLFSHKRKIMLPFVPFLGVVHIGMCL